MNDFTDAFISQSKAAELLGFPPEIFEQWLLKNENKQISVGLFQKAIMAGQSKGYEKSFKVAEKLLEAAIKSYFYQCALEQAAIEKLKLTRLITELENKSTQALKIML